MAFALGEDGHEHIRAGDFLAPGGLDMNDGAMNDALEPGRWLGFGILIDNQAVKIVVDIVDQLAAQKIQIDVAGTHDRSCVAILDQGKKQMLKRSIFMVPLIGEFQGAVKGLFQTRRERWHGELFLLHSTL